jgi:hypothetical protein
MNSKEFINNGEDVNNEELNGIGELVKALKKFDIDLVKIIAETSIWVSPEVCEQLKQKTGDVVWSQKVRRGHSDEKKGDLINGIRIDDNTYANRAIKKAVGIDRTKIKDYTTCHIWEGTCYDEHYHTAIPNLVLIPSAIAGLSDYFEEIINALKYRSYELYGWYPKKESRPEKPCNYPDNWKEPINTTIGIDNKKQEQEEREILIEIESSNYLNKIRNEIVKVERKIPGWFQNSDQINSTILITFLRLSGDNSTKTVFVKDLENKCNIKTFKSNFKDMSNISDHGHGKVFEVIDDEITLWEPVAQFILNEWNKYPRLH